MHFSTNFLHLIDKYESGLLLLLSPALAVVKQIRLIVNSSGIRVLPVEVVIEELGDVRVCENRVYALMVFWNVEQVGLITCERGEYLDFLMLVTETTRMALHREAWQCFWQNRASDLQG